MDDVEESVLRSGDGNKPLEDYVSQDVATSNRLMLKSCFCGGLEPAILIGNLATHFL